MMVLLLTLMINWNNKKKDKIKDEYDNYLKKLKNHREEYLKNNGNVINLQDLVMENNKFLNDLFAINGESKKTNFKNNIKYLEFNDRFNKNISILTIVGGEQMWIQEGNDEKYDV